METGTWHGGREAWRQDGRGNEAGAMMQGAIRPGSRATERREGMGSRKVRDRKPECETGKQTLCRRRDRLGGSEAARQRGSEAARQRGSEAARRVGRQACRLASRHAKGSDRYLFNAIFCTLELLISVHMITWVCCVRVYMPALLHHSLPFSHSPTMSFLEVVFNSCSL